MKKRTPKVLIGLALILTLNVQAMGLFKKEPPLRQTELSSGEIQQLSIQSGWSNDEPDLMMFEVGNKLSGPIFCVGASFEFKDGKKRNQAFEPKLYVPASATRRVSVRGIEKKHVKTFNMSCLCMKANAQGPCEKVFN